MRCAPTIAPTALAEMAEAVVTRLQDLAATPGDEGDGLAECTAEARRIASGLRALSLITDPHQADGLAQRGEELRSIVALVGQTAQALARSNQRLADEVSTQGEQLDELTHLDRGESVPTDRVRRVVEALHQTTSEVEHDLDHVATGVQDSNDHVAALEAQLEEARRKARYDALTQVHSRAALDERLARQMDEDRDTWCLLIADLDRFKDVNDTLGHLVGDALLYKIAQTLQTCAEACPGDAFVGRYGGEEFAVLLPGVGLAQAREIAETMRRRVQNSRYQLRARADAVVNPTVSIGVAQRRPGDTVAVLIDRADAALYEAKRQGRNRVAVADADATPRAAAPRRAGFRG
ncbi:MAG: GGDEF domain-containing protein [Planctomycetota bacterium]